MISQPLGPLATRPIGKSRFAEPRILEKHVQEAVTQFLEIDGWRHLRTDPVSDRATVNSIRRAIAGVPALNHVRDLILKVIQRCVRGKGFGEPGMADDLFIRYVAIPDATFQDLASVMWIEFKRPGEKPRPDQIRWHEAERAKGALVLVVDSIDQFRKDYFAMGLARKVRS